MYVGTRNNVHVKIRHMPRADDGGRTLSTGDEIYDGMKGELALTNGVGQATVPIFHMFLATYLSLWGWNEPHPVSQCGNK